MATETQTQTGQSFTDGNSPGHPGHPKMGFPLIVYAYMRSRAQRKPFLCPECGEAVQAD